MDVMFSWSRYTSDILSCFNQLEISVLLSVPRKCTAFWAQLCETNGAVSGLLLCIQVIYVSKGFEGFNTNIWCVFHVKELPVLPLTHVIYMQMNLFWVSKCACHHDSTASQLESVWRCSHLVGQLVGALLHVRQLVAHVRIICHGC